ncbi:CHAP domain-containing protein [Pedobacter sp. AW31-3R]|uniref:CHAP domain-containing protein n=1 Tax=Pedobacter sp. AW31-3R TaxID=3445781 RepID=UPI003FA0F787
MTRAQKIIAEAEKYIGLTERPGNKGFFNAPFEKLMKSNGFYSGAPWCAFFTKMIYANVYADHQTLEEIIRRCNTGGALDTLKRHENNGTFSVGEVPKPGAIAVWRNGKGPAGHHGIVKSVDLKANTMVTIEGNTNASGSREGDRVAVKLRTITRTFKNDGLNIEGYIYALED